MANSAVQKEKRVFRFNDSGEPQATEQHVIIPPRDPIFSLEEEDTIPRHSRQLDRIVAAQKKQPWVAFHGSVFGASMDWACRCYRVSGGRWCLLILSR